MKSEVIEAIRMLAKEKEIPEETLFHTIEEALKAAYKKNLPKSETAPNNLDVTVNRQDGSISVYARKLILEDEEIEDPTNQISLKEAQKINPSYQMGDIAEVDVTPIFPMGAAAMDFPRQVPVFVIDIIPFHRTPPPLLR